MGAMDIVPATNTEKILLALDRSSLDAGARAAVLEAVTAGMTMPATKDEGRTCNRQQYRAAASWMRRYNRRGLKRASV